MPDLSRSFRLVVWIPNREMARRVSDGKPVYIRDCAECGVAFLSRTRRSLYCEKRCKQAAYRTRIIEAATQLSEATSAYMAVPYQVPADCACVPVPTTWQGHRTECPHYDDLPF